MSWDWVLQTDRGQAVFGDDSASVVMSSWGVEPGKARVDDRELPRADGLRFGQDFRGGQTARFSLWVNGDDEAGVLAELSALAAIWRNDGGRSISGSIATLRHPNGRFMFGRPRAFESDAQRAGRGYATVKAEFEAQDDLWYGPEELTRVRFVPPSPVQSFAWLGEVDASASVMRVNGEVVARNDFTNPNLVGDGTWAEVRRNAIANPGAREGSTFATSWAGATGNTSTVTASAPAPWSKSGSAYRVEWNAVAAPDSGDAAIFVGPALLAKGAQVGETWTLVFSHKSRPGTRLNPPNTVGTGFASIPSRSRTVALVTEGETVYKEYVTFTLTLAPEAAQRIGFTVGLKVPGTFVELSMADLYPGEYQPGREYMDGTTKPAGIVQPEDFRVRWIGTPNASESVMEIERVRGLTTINAAAGVSTKDGKPAVRVIPTTANNDSSIRFGIPADIRGSGVIVGTLHTIAPLGGTLSGRRMFPSAWSGSTVAQISPPPNIAGTYPQRQDYANLSSVYEARLYHGGSLGSGDVWWTDIGLFAPGYTGPVFSGSSPTVGGGLVFPATAPFTFDSGPAVRNGSVLVAGDVATWPVFEIYGPVTNPEIEVVGVGRLVFKTTLAYDQFLRVDTRPWARWVQRGYVQNPTVLSPLPGALSPSGSRLSDMALRPGAYQVLLRGYDPSGTAELGVVLNPAYTSF